MNKKAMLAAGLLAGAAALTGCAGPTVPVATPTPAVSNQETAEPQTAEPSAQPTAQGAETTPETDGADAPIALRVDGQEASVGALEEEERLLLPLVETGELLGWKVSQEQVEEEGQTRCTVALEREDSRITVAWVNQDNTIRQITWQKDGLLVPVDTMLTSYENAVYAPAAFFEEATGAKIDRTERGVEVTSPESKRTPETEEQKDE